MAPSFAVSDLPAALREQLLSLREGEHIELLEGDRVVGTLTGPRVLAGTVIPAPRTEEPESEREGVKLVATGMRLTEDVRAFLSTALGEEYAVVDIRRAPSTIDALLVPPLSAQALGMLRGQFPDARLIVTEVGDPDSDTWIEGPVSRAMAAGAHAYLASGTLADLATEVRQVVEGRSDRALSAGGGARESRELGPGR